MPLHSGLTMAEQMEVFEPSPPDSRKVVVATNIAEVGPPSSLPSGLHHSTSLGEHHYRRRQICCRLWLCEGCRHILHFWYDYIDLPG
jgi:hypothetical protein